MDKDESTTKKSHAKEHKRSLKINKKIVAYIAIPVVAIALLIGITYGYMYASTPAHIRKPAFQHYHFRTQILVDGKAVDFSKSEFQTAKDATARCSTDVGGTPIDFHDKTDQLTHVHWDGMTGGEFLKYYGWNLIGGSESSLGRRFDTGMLPKSVNIYGKSLPLLPVNTNFFVYVGDKNSYQQKSWNDFLNEDLETFFGKKSNIGQSNEVTYEKILNWFSPKALAHGDVIDEHQSNKSEEELTRINNVIGNVVIFVQSKEPSKEQIKARFDNLVPLSDSTCGD